MNLEINNQFIFETQSEIKRYHKNSIIINEGSTSIFFYSKRIPRGSASGSMRKSLKNGWFFITL